MHVVEKTDASNEEKLQAGARASDLEKLLGIPSFRQGGEFRGSQNMFDEWMPSGSHADSGGS